MQRTQTSVRLDESHVRYRVRIESDPCETPLHKQQMQLMLFDNFAQNPALTECGPGPFQKMTMQHTGLCWLVEFESTIEQAT